MGPDGVLSRFVADMRPEDEEILGNLLAEASGPGRAEKHERSRDSVPGKEQETTWSPPGWKQSG